MYIGCITIPDPNPKDWGALQFMHKKSLFDRIKAITRSVTSSLTGTHALVERRRGTRHETD